ncbi:MAG: transcription elongation factor GreAB [Puniceicoccaceae bacterium]|nr:MAG: transcription elongation factor GreAB [Puniceicoccaceae bacterium]
MTEDAVQVLISRNPALKGARDKLTAMQPGNYCIHRSWGFGQITGFDEADLKLLIDFESKKGHRMDPAFCATTLEILPPEHLLVRLQTEGETIRTMIKEQPVDLVIELLKIFPNGAASLQEAERVLQQVVGEATFKRWWAATRKLLTKDPRVSMPAKKTECIVLREEPVTQEEELVEDYENTCSARRRIQIVERFVDALDHHKEIKADLDSVLEGFASVVHDSTLLTPAQRLHGAWVRDDLANRLGKETAGFDPQAVELIANARDLDALAEELPTSLQPRMLELIKEAHPGEWKELTFGLLKNSKGKFTTDCINFLVANGLSDELGVTLRRWQTEQNLRAPVLLWIVKNRHSRKFSRLLHDMIGPRLLNAIFFAIDYEALQTTTARRIPLADVLSEDPDLIPDLLSTSDPETARDLASALLLNQGFEDLTKKSILARFIKLFPGVQSLVAGVSEEKDDRLLVSRESYDRRREEYETLVSKKIPENSRAIAEAREHGDLRENSEFKMAKQDQQLLLAQKAQLELDLARAQVTNFKEANADVIGVGSVVTLEDEKSGSRVTYTILGAWDSDPDNAIISYLTPMGGSLMGRRIGDTILLSVEGEESQLTVKAIGRYVDQLVP